MGLFWSFCSEVSQSGLLISRAAKRRPHSKTDFSSWHPLCPVDWAKQWHPFFYHWQIEIKFRNKYHTMHLFPIILSSCKMLPISVVCAVCFHNATLKGVIAEVSKPASDERRAVLCFLDFSELFPAAFWNLSYLSLSKVFSGKCFHWRGSASRALPLRLTTNHCGICPGYARSLQVSSTPCAIQNNVLQFQIRLAKSGVQNLIELHS